MKLSIVIPIYNEEESINELVTEILNVVKANNYDYELILVNDGSSDKTEQGILKFCADNNSVKLINFKKNLGQTPAVLAGFNHAVGDYIVTLDADMQNDPNDIPKLLAYADDNNYDIVSGYRKNRKDALISRKIPSKLANKLISVISGVKLNDFGCTLKVYRKEVIKDLKLYGEMHRFIPAIAAWQGAKIGELVVNHRERKYGKSKYGIKRTFKVLLDLITIKFIGSYSTRPLYFFGGAGLMSIFISFLMLSYLIIRKLSVGESMIVSPLLHLSALVFMVGFQSILIGLLAEIMIRIYFESLNKPIYLIKNKVNLPD